MIITPLVALINDQVSKLKKIGISVCCVNSTMAPSEREIVFHELTSISTQYKFLYLTAEYALSPAALAEKTMEKMEHYLDLLLMRHMRPLYGQLSTLKQFSKPVVVYTGTANGHRAKNCEKFGLQGHIIL